MGGALRHQQTADGGAANHAGLSGALVNAVLHLEKSPAAFRVHVIGNRRTSRVDGIGEHIDDGPVQAAGALGGEAVGKSQRMDTGAKQGFIGIDIADAPDEGLVEQQGLDADPVTL